MLRKRPHVHRGPRPCRWEEKAEGGLAWVTGVGRVMEWIWPWSLQPAGPPPGHTQQDCEAFSHWRNPHTGKCLWKDKQMQSCSCSLPAPPRCLCSHGNPNTPKGQEGHCLQVRGAQEASTHPGRFSTQSSSGATLGRDKQAGWGWRRETTGSQAQGIPYH